MRSNKSILYAATVITSLLSLNLEAIASNQNQSSGPFDIPSKTNTVDPERKLRIIHSEHDELIDELVTSREEHQRKQQRQQQIPRSREEIHEARKLRSKRMKEQRERAKKIIREHQPEVGQLERMPANDIQRVYGNVVKNDPNLEKEDNRWLRNLGKRNLESSSQSSLADVATEYGKLVKIYSISFLPETMF